ncbi:efflux transporter, outer membrane factor (OMF) lipoprotein, NodT family [Pseudomonas congelans]|uniref:Efflux transporter, outer membrane factor (OMF) lipoprotein, NodT family n=1 Tax=Pseudomonas congelans TaxID=200452 RepID=A0A0N8R293_9PSED|nr:efflux transporter outer membrane subunit [Pseudomonas congelans]KPW86150.1 RND efflux system, outer membrane lipoprotein, NodT [Pseudomonas congelans]SDO43752.1 efflux transporter, outer membrane factor (OMF) lipoprotein, NodT family [Pseudomonas congelans]
MRPLCTYVLVMSTGLLSGCAVGPDYRRPDAPLPDRYLTQPRGAANITAHPLVSAAWWDGFDDPLLSSFVSRALAQNLDLAQASAQLAQARAGADAATAALLPAGNIDAQTARAHQSVETPLGQVLNSAPGYDRYGNSYEANLTASWELDVFGGLRRSRQAALAEYQASQAGVAAARLAVAARTADTYITIRGLQARLAITRRQVQTRQDLLEKVQLLYERGLSPEYEVRQIEAELLQVQATMPILQTGLDAAMNALDVMLGVPPGTHRSSLAEAGPIPHTPELASTGTPADLLRRRPDLIVAERRLAASNARIGVAISEYYPKLSLSALLGSATAVSSGNLFTGGASQSAGVLGLRWRLFDFGRVNARIGQAKGQEAEALAAYRQSVLRATEDVENAFSSLANRETQAAMLDKGEAALASARQSSFASYSKGAASLIEVLRADEKMLQVADSNAQAKVESAQAAVAVFKALGGGWQAPPTTPEEEKIHML